MCRWFFRLAKTGANRLTRSGADYLEARVGVDA
jgi:hypothetical protein